MSDRIDYQIRCTTVEKRIMLKKKLLLAKGLLGDDNNYSVICKALDLIINSFSKFKS